MAVTSGSGDDREPEPPNIPALLVEVRHKSAELLITVKNAENTEDFVIWAATSLRVVTDALEEEHTRLQQMTKERDALREERDTLWTPR